MPNILIVFVVSFFITCMECYLWIAKCHIFLLIYEVLKKTPVHYYELNNHPIKFDVGCFEFF